MTTDRMITLCDTCIYENPTCDSQKQEYGDSPGNDNIIKCDTYLSDGGSPTPQEEPEKPAETAQEQSQKPVEPTPEELGDCSSCGEPLKEIPLNSRVIGTICNNPRCALFRNRIRTRNLPVGIRKLSAGYYLCKRCGKVHQFSSKLGKSHLRLGG